MESGADSDILKSQCHLLLNKFLVRQTTNYIHEGALHGVVTRRDEWVMEPWDIRLGKMRLPVVTGLNHPVDTRREINVIMTSKRRRDVVLTS